MIDFVVGIDLGTTNSEIAAYVGDRVRILGSGTKMLPSCVGFSPTGELLVGQAARNQQILYPERTVRSVKRRMGMQEAVPLGDKTFTPQEISALILRELVQWARSELGQPVEKAVITVPAYFSDAQRTATREAGMLAGLEVVRILNEPTAASLAYGFGDASRPTALIYDLGGDDFDDLLLERLEQEFERLYGIDLRHGHAAAHARLWWAAEEAKKKLSFEPYVSVREENLVIQNGKALHLDLELSRTEYEEMILRLVESTLDSVSKTLADAGKGASDLDAILLVGGSTRTPLSSRLLRERSGLEPRQDVHPDLCVALGAGVLASRLAGHEVERVLVDVSPYSFGPSYLGDRGGFPYAHCYHPIIYRNTPLLFTRTESYAPDHPYQTSVRIEIYQGEDEDALKNILVGDFRVEGLQPTEEPNEVLCRMSLDVDGILHVTATEKQTGKSKHITVANALQTKTAGEIEAARQRLKMLYSRRAQSFDDSFETREGEVASAPDLRAEVEGESVASASAPSENLLRRPGMEAVSDARILIERSRRLLEKMHPDDKEEAIGLHESIETAIDAGDPATLEKAIKDLGELLFFVKGQ